MTQLELPGLANVIMFRALRRAKRKTLVTPPPAASCVTVFPIECRVSMLQRITRALDELEGDEREGFWANACMSLASELRHAHQSESAVAGYLCRLQAAVQATFDQDLSQPSGRHDGGAA